MVELENIIALADGFEVALADELQAKYLLADAESDLEKVKAMVLLTAYQSGEIDGKNADIRSKQEAVVLSNSVQILEAERRIALCQGSSMRAEVNCKTREHEIGLMKAWLYSQCRIG